MMKKSARGAGAVRVFSILLAAVLCLSVFLTGTFAWNASQSALNELSGAGADVFPVQLELYERAADGTVTTDPVSGAEFYIYTSAGVKVGDLYMTGPDGRIVTSLPAGSYYFEEADPGYGNTYDKDAQSADITQYAFTVTAGAVNPVVITAYNIRTVGSLTVTKEALNADGSDLTQAQRDTLFTFTVAFDGLPDGPVAAQVGGADQTPALTDGELTVQLKSGQTAVFDDIPVNVRYAVYETPVSGYVTSSADSSGGIVASGATAAFVNTYSAEADKAGSLTVTKQVVNADGSGLTQGEQDTAFSFTAVVGNGTQTFTLKSGESRTIGGVAQGTAYRVTETPADGYTAVQDEYSGSIGAANLAVTLPFVNVHENAAPAAPGSLTITKQVVNADGSDLTQDEQDAEFSFTATIGGAAQTFTLKSGESKTIGGIPAGTAYSVAETPADGYAAAAGEYDGTIGAGQAVTLPFVNTQTAAPAATGSLTVGKTVTGAGADPAQEFAFEIVFSGEGAPTPATQDFTLKSGETKTFSDIPEGVAYAVAETPVSGYTADFAQAQGTINGDAAVGFVNDYAPAPAGAGSLTVTKQAVNADGSGLTQEQQDTAFGFTAVIGGASQAFTLKSGESKTIDGIPDGTAYSVTETPADGYAAHFTQVKGTVSGDAAVGFVNTAAPQSHIIIHKIASGEGFNPDQEFSFTVYINGSPLPDKVTLKAGEQSAPIPINEGDTYAVVEDNGIVAGYVGVHLVNGMGTADGPEEDVTETNLYVGPLTADISGEKTWDKNGQNVSLPASVTVNLMDGNTVAGTAVVTPDPNGKWLYDWVVPARDPQGGAIPYTVAEVPVDGWAASYDGYNITNTSTYSPDTMSVRMTVAWNDSNDPNRPQSIQVQLYKDGAPQGSPVTLNAAGGWTYVWAGLDKNAVWTVDEPSVPSGYSRVISGDAINGFTITNTKSGGQNPNETVTVSGKATWNYGDAPASARPTSMVVVVRADGAVILQKQVTAADNWAWSFILPKYAADGHEIRYTVDEVQIDGYAKQVSGYNIINTYAPPKQNNIPGNNTPSAPAGIRNPEDGNAKTGDTSNAALWLLTLTAGLLGVVILTLWRLRAAKRYRPKH